MVGWRKRMDTKALNYNFEDNRIFWMEYSDFCANFTKFYVLRVLNLPIVPFYSPLYTHTVTFQWNCSYHWSCMSSLHMFFKMSNFNSLFFSCRKQAPHSTGISGITIAKIFINSPSLFCRSVSTINPTVVARGDEVQICWK